MFASAERQLIDVAQNGAVANIIITVAFIQFFEAALGEREVVSVPDVDRMAPCVAAE